MINTKLVRVSFSSDTGSDTDSIKNGETSNASNSTLENVKSVDDIAIVSDPAKLTIPKSSKPNNQETFKHQNFGSILNKLTNIIFFPSESLNSAIKLDSCLISDDDGDSVYESESCVTETLFRSESFFQLPKLSLSEEEDEITEHGFYLDDFNSTFNLKDNRDKQEKIKSDDIQYDENSTPSDSLISGDAFSDILTEDILADLDSLPQKLSAESGISFDEDKVSSIIISKLKKDLEPILLKLSVESEKYYILKKLYNLPSISDLEQDEIKKCKKGRKQFSLEFNEDIINKMIKNEFKKTERRNMAVDFINVKDQVNLNFSQLHQLNTIVEENESEKSYFKDFSSVSMADEVLIKGEKISKENLVDTLLEIPSKSKSYRKFDDTRSVQEISSGELFFILEQIEDGNFKDLSKVKHLVSVFEKQLNENTINKLDNKLLRTEILIELENRKSI